MLNRMWLDGNSQWGGAWCSILAAAWSQHPPEKPSFSHLCPNDLGPISGIKHDKIRGKLGRAKVGGITQKKKRLAAGLSPEKQCSHWVARNLAPQNPTVPDGTRHSKWLVIGWFFLHKYGNNM